MALLQPRFGLPMHLLTAMGVLALAAGFGEMAAVPCTLAPLALAVWGAHLSNPRIVALMVVLTAWLIVYPRVTGGRTSRATPVVS